jgi:hypothetical protein
MTRRKANYDPRNPLEEEDHIALAELLDYAKILYFHTPNELMVKNLPDKQRWRILNKMIKMGAKSGVPDFVILTRPPLMPEARAVFLELKRRKGGKVSPTQANWHKALRSEGFSVIVAHGFDEAVKKLKNIGFELTK